jgi:hypothetical protein
VIEYADNSSHLFHFDWLNILIDWLIDCKKNQSKQVICVFSYILISIRLIIFHRTESKFLNYMYILTYIMTVQYTLNTNQSINQSIYSINQSEINGMNCQRILSLVTNSRVAGMHNIKCRTITHITLMLPLTLSPEDKVEGGQRFGQVLLFR